MRKKNQNGGKAQRATPPPTGARYNSHGSSNPPTPTSPYPGPPQSGSAGHSPVGLPGASPAYQPQQPPQQLPNHAPPPAQHQPIHRNNSQGPHHSHAPDTKVNGDAKNYGKNTCIWIDFRTLTCCLKFSSLLNFLGFVCLTGKFICTHTHVSVCIWCRAPSRELTTKGWLSYQKCFQLSLFRHSLSAYACILYESVCQCNSHDSSSSLPLWN